MRRQAGFILLTMAAALFAGTSGVWNSKRFQDWTAKDANLILKNSPWARQIPMPAGERPAEVIIEPGSNNASEPSASLGNPSNTTTGTNMTASGNPGSAGPADSSGRHTLSNTQTPSQMTSPSAAPALEPPLTIIWASATPVRLAVLKLRSDGKPPAEDQIANASKERANYVIAVVGLPPPEAGSDPGTLAHGAFLNVRRTTPEPATDSSYRKIGKSDVYFFRFSKASLPLSAQDQEVEFSMRMGHIEVKGKFNLRNMRYQGQLAL